MAPPSVTPLKALAAIGEFQGAQWCQFTDDSLVQLIRPTPDIANIPPSRRPSRVTPPSRGSRHLPLPPHTQFVPHATWPTSHARGCTDACGQGHLFSCHSPLAGESGKAVLGLSRRGGRRKAQPTGGRPRPSAAPPPRKARTLFSTPPRGGSDGEGLRSGIAACARLGMRSNAPTDSTRDATSASPEARDRI